METQPNVIVDISDIEKILQKSEYWSNKLREDPANLGTRAPLFAVLTIIPQFLEDKNKIVGVYHCLTSIPLAFRSYDYYFDFRDNKGNLILPFTKENPFYAVSAYFTNVFDIFPEFSDCSSVCAGIFTNDLRDTLIKRPFITTFPGLECQYRNGEIIRKVIPEKKEAPTEQKIDIEIRKELLALFTLKTSEEIIEEKLNNLQKQYDTLQTEFREMWEKKYVSII